MLARLDDEQTLMGDMLVLSTGPVQARPERGSAVGGPWQPVAAPDPESRIIIVGFGLSMMDQVLSILKSGHRGEILSISRRGQLPRAHAPSSPLKLGPGDIPQGLRMSGLMLWLRDLAARAERDGGNWRDAVDGVRPHVRSIWRSLPDAERARFLRHGATWWDVHRHRMPPASYRSLRGAIASGQRVLRRAGFVGAKFDSAGRRVATIRPHRAESTEDIVAFRVIDCRGIRLDPENHAAPLVANLLETGLATIDRLRINPDVGADCHRITKTGNQAQRLYAIGPASRAAFWEITAIPDIREQVAKLAEALAVC